MAKSLRSHRERRLRAFKRIRYRQKELERLKKQLGITENGDGQRTDEDGAASSSSNVLEFGFEKAKEIKERMSRKRKLKEDADAMEVDEKDDCDEKIATSVRKKGTYPVWMNQRHIRHIKHFLKKKKKRDRQRAKRNNRKSS